MRFLLYSCLVCLSLSEDDLDILRMNIPGEPGSDYPIHSFIPENNFSCGDDKIFGGYYADPQHDCQVYHVCIQDEKNDLSHVSFLCPNGTIFNQELFICDWWFNVHCNRAERFYSKNEALFADGDGLLFCPVLSPAAPGSCQGAVSSCWSPGSPDTDCPNNGLCCFDGCSNTCRQGYSHDVPDVTLPMRPTPTPPSSIYGPPKFKR